MWKSSPEELLVGLEKSQCNGKGFTDVSWQWVQIVWISSAKMCLKGLGHQMNIFEKAYKLKIVISVKFLTALFKRKIDIKFLFASLKTLKALFGRFSPEYI